MSLVALKSAGERFFLLDGIRGVAAIMVLLLHAGIALGMPKPENAEVAVDIFFCLSGFVMCEAYRNKVGTRIDFRGFAYRRFVRLYPMIFVGTLIGGAIFVGSPNAHQGYSRELTLLTFTASFFLIPAPLFFGIPSAFPTDTPLWSLFFEVVLNGAIYATLRGRVGWKGYLAIAAFSGIGLVFAALYVGDVFMVGIGSVTSYVLALFRAAFPFFIGAAIAISGRTFVSRPLFVVLAIGLLAFAFWGDVAARGTIHHLAVCLIAVPALIFLGAGLEVGAMGKRLCTFLGDLSYPLYVMHMPILQVMRVVNRKIDPANAFTSIAFYALTVAICVTVSQLVLVLYDEPLRRWLQALKGSRLPQS